VTSVAVQTQIWSICVSRHVCWQKFAGTRTRVVAGDALARFWQSLNMVTGAGQPDIQDADTGEVDFFVSYTAADEAWATWIGVQLEAAGQRVRLQAWDSPAGENFVVWVSGQMQAAARTIAVCSAAYFHSHWCTQEWTGALAGRKVIPLRVTDCTLPPVLAATSWRDLYGLDEPAARRRLLEAVGLAAVARVASGAFPGGAAKTASFPERLPEVWNVPGRLASFTGRTRLLEQMHDQLCSGGRDAVTALRGLGGVGKTQLTVEYAWRYARDYRLAWWVDAERTALLGEQFTVLASRIGLPTSGRVAEDAAAMLDWLRHQDGWLLVFDNAESPAGLRPWLPGGAGHVLITSRNPAWGGLAACLDVDVLDRADAVTFLAGRLPGLESGLADAIAAEVGDLPLALEQTAAYLEATGMPPQRWMRRFRARRAELLAKGHDLAYGGTVDSAWTLALDRLATESPAAAQLLGLAAQLGPDPIPLALLTGRPDLLNPPLADIAADDSLDLEDVLGAILGYALARREGDAIQLHRLVAAVIRARVPDRDELQAAAQNILAASVPADHKNTMLWSEFRQVTPHVLAAWEHADTAGTGPFRKAVITVNAYLRRSGQSRAAHELSSQAHSRWHRQLGADHPDTLHAALGLAADLRILGEHQAAREMNEDTLARRRRVLGDDHRDTLKSAHNLARDFFDLGEHAAARQLDEDTLARRRRVLGDDHPDTLYSAKSLAVDLAALGQRQAARELNEHTYAKMRRVLGDNHTYTLTAAHNLARDFFDLGEHAAARQLDEDTLARRRRVLGDDHPYTLTTAHYLACDLRTLGEHAAARQLDEDTLARRRRVLGDDHPDTLKSADSLAADLAALG